jgi:hypothetical protein
MNGKNKLFSEFLSTNVTPSTTKTVKDVPGELEGAPVSSGNFSGQGQVMVDYFKSKVK